jgi:O-antigen ligase
LGTLTIWTQADWTVLLIQTGFFVVALPGAPATSAILISTLLPLWGLAQLSFHQTSVPWFTLRATLHWLAIAAIFWTAHATFASATTRRWFLKAAAVFAVLLCILSLLQFFTSEAKHFWIWKGAEPQIFGPFQSRNNFATFAILTTPLVLWRGIERGHTAWHWLAGAALMVGAVAASGSRAGAALMLVELAAFAFLARQLLGRTTILAGTALILASVSVTGWTHLAGKLNDSDPWRYRREMMSSAIRMASDRPALGHGLGTYPQVYPAFATFDSGYRVNHAHNDWAEWAAEGGVPFVALLVAAALEVLPTSVRYPWALGLPLVCGHALVDYPFQRIGVAFWFIVIAAAVLRESATFGKAQLSSNDG